MVPLPWYNVQQCRLSMRHQHWPKPEVAPITYQECTNLQGAIYTCSKATFKSRLFIQCELEGYLPKLTLVWEHIRSNEASCIV